MKSIINATLWSECVAYGKKLQNGEPGIIDRIKTVKRVDFRDFVKSWRTLDERQSEGEIQAVKKVLGIIQHLKSVWLEDCNLCEDHLRMLHDVFKEVEIDELYIYENTNIGVEGWYYIGHIVLQSRVKSFDAGDCDVTDERLERFMQGMDGAQLDILDITCDYGDIKNVDSINVLLKLLLLICEQLHLCGWKFSEDQEEEVQKKLDEDCHKNLTITYGEWEEFRYFKASPIELAPILPSVEGLKARETNGSVRLEWDPLSIVSISYYIIVENDLGKAVGEPIVTSYTNCQLSSLQSHEWYEFFIWGYTDDGISKRCAGIHHFTGKITETKQSPEPGTSLHKRKRTDDVLDSGASKGKKRKGKKGSPKEGSTLDSWFATEGQYESSVYSQTSSNGVIRTVESHLEIGNSLTQQGHVALVQRSASFNVPAAMNVSQTSMRPDTSHDQPVLQQLQPYPTTDNIYQHSQQMMENEENYHQRAVPQQTNIQQGTSYDQSANQQPQQYSTVGEGFQQPQMMENTENHHLKAMSQQTNISYDQPVHQQQQNYFTDDNVHQHPQQMMDNSTDQGFQQPLMPVMTDTSTLLPDTQSFSSNTAADSTEYATLRPVRASFDGDMRDQTNFVYAAGPSDVNVHPTTVGQIAPTITDQTFNMAPAVMGHHMNVGQTNFQQVIQRQEEMIQMQNKVIKMQEEKAKMQEEKVEMLEEKIKMLERIRAQDVEIAKLKRDNEEMGLLTKKVDSLEQQIQGMLTSTLDENRNQISFILPMKTAEDVEENEKLLDDKQYWTKLADFLSKVSGDGKDAVRRIMANLFSDQLARMYSWTGRKNGKKALRKLKMAKIIYSVSIEKNIDNKECEAAAMRWLKNAADRDGGRRRRERANKKRIERGGAGTD